MLYTEIIAVCSQIHTKHINTLCGQNVAHHEPRPGVDPRPPQYRPATNLLTTAQPKVMKGSNARHHVSMNSSLLPSDIFVTKPSDLRNKLWLGSAQGQAVFRQRPDACCNRRTDHHYNTVYTENNLLQLNP